MSTTIGTHEHAAVLETFSVFCLHDGEYFKNRFATVKHVESYTLACLALHKYLRQTKNAGSSPSGFTDSENNSGNLIPGEWWSLNNRNNAFEDFFFFF